MPHRRQRTIEQRAVVSGRGLFSGNQVKLELLPAPEFHGIVFQRIDVTEPVRIPARIDYVVPETRRTVLARNGVRVEVVEHVLAALAGLQIDNCLVRLNAPECPNGDGSARCFVDALLGAMPVAQSAVVPRLEVDWCIAVDDPSSDARLTAQPAVDGGFRIEYALNHPSGVIPPRTLEVAITPESFLREIASARTFVLESEVAALRAHGLGLTTTTGDLLVFDAAGRPIDNPLRMPDECVRHKILDCIGDFALAAADLSGTFRAERTGHRHNHELIRRITSVSAAARSRAA